MQSIRQWRCGRPTDAVWLVLAFLLTALSAEDSLAQVQPPAGEAETTESTDEEPKTYLDEITVTATLSPSPVRDTPGVVSVIDGDTIGDRMIESFADLVKFEPGVYVENDVTRLGLNGFNIRGVGGNRVMTQIDGVQTSEQFAFGPFSVHQPGLDVDTLRSVEIVRSANSALYGSDALGGVVSLFTKDPADYLRDQKRYLGFKTTWDGRANDASANVTVAYGNERVQGSLFTSFSKGNEFKNQGTVEALDATRTAPNPQDRRGLQALGKVVFTAAPGNVLRGSVEVFDTEVDTTAYSMLGTTFFGPVGITTTSAEAVDTQARWRVSLDHTLTPQRGLDLITWRVYGQGNDTSQAVDESRSVAAFGPPTLSVRNGTLDFEQRGLGASARAQHWLGGAERGALVTFGANYRRDRFDVLRDRNETSIATGESVPTSLIFPAKYFPESAVNETGGYAQAEIRLDRLTIVPGLRYDRFSMNADQMDVVYLAGLNPVPADFSADALSPKIGATVRVTDELTAHAQYARGFRAPPYSSINTGFTNLGGGYTTLPNSDLRAETSDNVEVGLRASFARTSFGVTAFSNRYDDFIELTAVGFNPATFLLEFQSQNLSEVEIEGVEVRADAFLTDRVRLRASWAEIKGTNVSGDTDIPLGSVTPDAGVVGIQYIDPAGWWTSELAVRITEGQTAADAGDGQFAPGAYQIVDLVTSIRPADAVTVRIGLLNLTDETYFEWWNVRGRGTDDPVIDRYSSPGRSLITSLALDW